MEALEFRILGPLRVMAAGRPLALPAPGQRALLLRANQVVAAERLVDDLWG